MIIAGLAALMIGLGQFGILHIIIESILHGNIRSGILFIVLKLAIYGLFTFLLIKVFVSFLITAVIFFGLGFFISLFVYIIKTLKTL